MQRERKKDRSASSKSDLLLKQKNPLAVLSTAFVSHQAVVAVQSKRPYQITAGAAVSVAVDLYSDVVIC